MKGAVPSRACRNLGFGEASFVGRRVGRGGGREGARVRGSGARAQMSWTVRDWAWSGQGERVGGGEGRRRDGTFLCCSPGSKDGSNLKSRRGPCGGGQPRVPSGDAPPLLPPLCLVSQILLSICSPASHEQAPVPAARDRNIRHSRGRPPSRRGCSQNGAGPLAPSDGDAPSCTPKASVRSDPSPQSRPAPRNPAQTVRGGPDAPHEPRSQGRVRRNAHCSRISSCTFFPLLPPPPAPPIDPDSGADRVRSLRPSVPCLARPRSQAFVVNGVSYPLNLSSEPVHSELVRVSPSSNNIQAVAAVSHKANVKPGSNKGAFEKVGLSLRGNRQLAEKEREGKRCVGFTPSTGLETHAHRFPHLPEPYSSTVHPAHDRPLTPAFPHPTPPHTVPSLPQPLLPYEPRLLARRSRGSPPDYPQFRQRTPHPGPPSARRRAVSGSARGLFPRASLSAGVTVKTGGSTRERARSRRTLSDPSQPTARARRRDRPSLPGLRSQLPPLHSQSRRIHPSLARKRPTLRGLPHPSPPVLLPPFRPLDRPHPRPRRPRRTALPSTSRRPLARPSPRLGLLSRTPSHRRARSQSQVAPMSRNRQ